MCLLREEHRSLTGKKKAYCNSCNPRDDRRGATTCGPTGIGIRGRGRGRGVRRDSKHLTWWDWCNCVINFTKMLLLLKWQLLHVYTRTHPLTILKCSLQLLTISAHNWRMNNTFIADSQKHSHKVTLLYLRHSGFRDRTRSWIKRLNMQNTIWFIMRPITHSASFHRHCLICVTVSNLDITVHIHHGFRIIMVLFFSFHNCIFLGHLHHQKIEIHYWPLQQYSGYVQR